MSIKRTLLICIMMALVYFGLVSTLPSFTVFAQSCDSISCNEDDDEDDYLACIKDKSNCWQDKINESKAEQQTLQSTISILNGQIAIQELAITQTQTEISQLETQIIELSDRISGLDVSLDKLGEVLVTRIAEDYKRRKTQPWLALMVNQSLNEALADLKYLQKARQQTVALMTKAETQRANYDEQKTTKEQAQTQLEVKEQQLAGQQAELNQQKNDQEYLLSETKNDEARYQRELEKTLGELEAIQSIIAGRGSESSVGDVSEGETIASVIVGASACSTGTHLHFEVVKDGTHRDPAGYLQSIDAIWSNSPDGSFGFGGDWRWPLNNAARINQGYGMTYYARVRRAYGGAPHTGIDMVSKTSGSNSVKAVQDGTLYRGSIACGGGVLRYVRVEHDDNISTYYLHVNY